LKWWIRASIDRFISARRGGLTLLSSVSTGPGVARSFSMACRMILVDSRISCMRHR
jgi:hypothetical protein